MPCTTRAAISAPRLGAAIARIVPMMKTVSAVHVAVRSPRRSSHRPQIGMVTVEATR